jgi:putative oxidoreductase
MNKMVLVARILLGLGFTAFGLMFFFTTPPAMEGDLGSLMGLMASSKWIHLVKVLEIVGGLLLLVGRVPLGLVVLGPIIVNILFVHIAFLPAGLPLPIVLALLEAFLIKAHWSNFAAIFK